MELRLDQVAEETCRKSKEQIPWSGRRKEAGNKVWGTVSEGECGDMVPLPHHHTVTGDSVKPSWVEGSKDGRWALC